MAYVVITSKDGLVIERRELTDSLLVGRAATCGVRVHDILLSREHCRLEKQGGQWLVIDLGSRNGTLVNGERIERCDLRDGDRVVAGRTQIRFHEGVLSLDEPEQKTGLLERPTDPFEAMSGTIVDFQMQPQFVAPIQRPNPRPTPRPMPVANVSESISPHLIRKVTEAESAAAAGSSPTWAAKPASRTARMKAAFERCAITHASAPPELVRPISEPLLWTGRTWQHRALMIVVETIVSAAITGVAVVALVTIFSHR